MELNETMRVSDLVIEVPAAILAMEALGIDYACRGNRMLVEACDAAGVDAEQWLSELELDDEIAEEAGISTKKWRHESLAALVNFIVAEHHQLEHRSIVYFLARIGRAAKSHGESYPIIHRVEHLFRRLSESLRVHITHEEKDLFRQIEVLEVQMSEGSRDVVRHGRTLTDRILIEFLEHDMVAEKLRTMREITYDWQLPTRSPKTLRTLWSDLRVFDRNLQRHMHLENNILYPRAIALEARAGAAAERALA